MGRLLQLLHLEDTSFRSVIISWGSAIAIILGIGFIIFQARFLITGPRIVLTPLPPGPYSERQITISGTAYNISRIWLNDRPIFTDVNGTFSEELVLENGYTVATLRAEDRFGRQTTLPIPLVYVPASLLPK